MKNNGVKAFLFAAAAAAVAAFIGYLSGALDPHLGRQPAELAQPASESPSTDAKAPEAAAGTEGEKQDVASAQAQQPATEQASAGPAASDENTEAPTFDVLRVEGDGSAVVAGKAAPGSTVELFDGTAVLGKAIAGPDGAFAIVLDTPLKAGDHQIVLRATGTDKDVSTSTQTAVVSIPEKPDGQVLAMIEEPGKAAQLLTVPQPQASADAAPADKPAGETVEGNAEASQVASADPAAGTAPPQEQAGEQQPVAEAAGPKIAVEAVEIDGGKVFVAGRADAGRKVRAYANEILLGEAVTSPDGHFLVEAARDLPVGEYTIRVDRLEAEGDKVAVRATVPFQREPGATVAAVAPPAQEGGSGQPVASAEGATDAGAGQPATTVAPKLEHVDGSVIIRRGDTLWHISRRVYGQGVRYSTIYLANQEQITDPDRIWPGQVFKVPEKSEQGEQADFNSMGDRITVPQ